MNGTTQSTSMNFINPGKIKRSVAVTLPAFAVLLFFFIKIIQFQLNRESFSDGMLALQLSRGWLEGRRLLFDTFYGNHQLIHNYYFIPLLGLLTKSLGIYGLFVGYLLLLAVFFWQWNDVTKQFSKAGKAVWFAVFLFAFGPFALFVYLDFYGWHPEQYFLPLLALLALSLAKRQMFWSIFWFLAAFLVKESSAIMLCSLLLFCSIADFAVTHPDKRPVQYFINLRNFAIITICLALFCLGMWWLAQQNSGQESRLTKAFLRITEKGNIKNLFLYCGLYCLTGLAIFVIGLLPFIPVLANVKNAKTIFLALAVGYFLIFSAFFTESLYYFPSIKLAIAYPPRAGGLWAFLMSSYVFLCCHFFSANPDKALYQKSWFLFGLALQILAAPILVAHNFDIVPDRQSLADTGSYLSKSCFGLKPYPEGIPHVLNKLAKKLPDGSEVVAPEQYITYFQNVYASAWPLEGQKLHLLSKPIIYIYEKQYIKQYGLYTFPEKSYVTIPHHQLLILADSLWYNRNFK
jgi:hypothetical protein